MKRLITLSGQREGSAEPFLPVTSVVVMVLVIDNFETSIESGTLGRGCDEVASVVVSSRGQLQAELSTVSSGNDHELGRRSETRAEFFRVGNFEARTSGDVIEIILGLLPASEAGVC